MFPPDTRILVIDDMPSIRDLVKNTLRAIGYKNIQEAGDGEDGLAAILKAHSAGMAFQLVISDWNMPNCTGLELLKKVRADSGLKTLPFLLLTAETEVSQVKQAVMAGVDNYVLKPFTTESLQVKIEQVHARRIAAKPA